MSANIMLLALDARPLSCGGEIMEVALRERAVLPGEASLMACNRDRPLRGGVRPNAEGDGSDEHMVQK
jgi:hypothetical protein